MYYYDNNPVNYFNSYFDKHGSLIFDEQTRSSKITPIHIWVSSINYSKKLGKKLKIESGLKGSASGFRNIVLIEKLVQQDWIRDNNLSSEYELTERIGAAYTSFNISVNKKTEVKAGLRYEYTSSNLDSNQTKNIVDRQFGKLFPSVFVSHKLNADHSIGFSYGRRITRPTFNDMAPFLIFVDPNTYFSGNPALRPSIADAIKMDYGFRKYLVSLSYHVNKDAIARFQAKIDPANTKQFYASENLTRVKTLSATLSVPLSITNWWTIQNHLTGTWQEVNSKYNNADVSIIQKNLRINALQNFILPKEFAIEISGFYQTTGMLGIAKLSPFGMLNVGIQKKIKKSKVRFGIDDVFQSHKIETSLYIPEQDVETKAKFKVMQRTYKLTYSLNFGNDKLKDKRNRSTGSEEERARVN